MHKGLVFLSIALLFICRCKNEKQGVPRLLATGLAPETQPPCSHYEKLFSENAAFVADGFDFPVGIPDAKGYYNAQPFRKNNHLGDDWNGTGGGNTDLGAPVCTIANGVVVEAKHQGAGWGNVVRIVHGWKENSEWRFVKSLYAHLDTMLVREKQMLMRREKIGTIGNAEGVYPAHLHLELRSAIGRELGPGYSSNTEGYLDPTEFIRAHRKIE